MKLVATDIDGTILPHGGEFSRRTVETLRAVVDSGVPVVLVTARPPRWMRFVVEALGHDGDAIIANGAAVMNLATQDVHSEITIGSDELMTVAEILRSELPGVKLALESARGMSLEHGGRRHSADFPPFEVGEFHTLAEVRDGRGFKILAHAEGHGGADAMLARVTPLLAGLVEPSHSAVDDSLLEFSPVGVSKATGLERFASALGFTADDVVAFGDAPNDIPMLQWAGTSYAVGGAHPSAKAAATHVAKSAENDGVASVLEELYGL